MSFDQQLNFDKRPGAASVPEREATAARARDAVEGKQSADELVRVRENAFEGF